MLQYHTKIGDAERLDMRDLRRVWAGMYEILVKEELNPVTKLFEVRAPAVARKAQSGQFVIIRTHEQGERIPLTIADCDSARGTISLVVQEVGKTTTEAV